MQAMLTVHFLKIQPECMPLVLGYKAKSACICGRKVSWFWLEN